MGFRPVPEPPSVSFILRQRAAAEGRNNEVDVATRRSYDSQTDDTVEIALNHTRDRLPEPATTHSFCWRANKDGG